MITCERHIFVNNVRKNLSVRGNAQPVHRGSARGNVLTTTVHQKQEQNNQHVSKGTCRGIRAGLQENLRRFAVIEVSHEWTGADRIVRDGAAVYQPRMNWYANPRNTENGGGKYSPVMTGLAKNASKEADGYTLTISSHLHITQNYALTYQTVGRFANPATSKQTHMGARL